MRKSAGDADLPPVVMPSCEVRRVLAGQKALVTGANSGIGKGVAMALGRAGAEVVVNYVASPEQAEEVVAEIRHEGAAPSPIRPTLPVRIRSGRCSPGC
jgi:NAD(P)-dependent dehydrogenase (short-subunit alcohol dehydrogenase family)